MPVLDRDRYRIGRQLGEGGISWVFSAEQLDTGRAVAIKLLKPEYETHPAAVAGIAREAQFAGLAKHPNVVGVLDYGNTQRGQVMVVLELLDGEDLASLLNREGPLPWARTKPLILQICAALEYIHGRGIVHRDIKPSNCFLVRRENQIKLLDFGVSSYAMTSANGDGHRGPSGTPAYMAPEEAARARHDPRSDIYSLGVTLCEILTGRLPFDPYHQALSWTEGPRQLPSLTELAGFDVDPGLEAVCARAMANDPADRFASVTEFAGALKAIPDTSIPERDLDPQGAILRALAQSTWISWLVAGTSLLAS